MFATTAPAPRSPNRFHTLLAPMFLMPHSTAWTRTFGSAEGMPLSRGTRHVGTIRCTSARPATSLSTGAVAPTTRMPLTIQNG